MAFGLVIGWVEELAGVLVMLVVLLDVFLTVLYVRAGTSLISFHLGQGVWELFRRVARLFHGSRAWIMSFCGPVVLLLIIAFWLLTLAFGAGLVIHAELGTGILSTMGETPTDFITAFYVGGASMSFVGASSFVPMTGSLKLLFISNSVLGAGIISLTLTYLMQVYSALQARNTLALTIFLLTGETSDAAEMIASLAPKGKVDLGYSHLTSIALQMAHVRESLHFYPVVVYFRFAKTFYSVSQFTPVSLDAIALIKTALSQDEYGWLAQSSAVRELEGSSMRILQTVSDNFRDGERADYLPDEQSFERWRKRYDRALKVLNAAGIRTNDDPDAVQQYITIRSHWQPYVNALAPAMALEIADIDPAAALDKSLTQDASPDGG